MPAPQYKLSLAQMHWDIRKLLELELTQIYSRRATLRQTEQEIW